MLLGSIKSVKHVQLLSGEEVALSGCQLTSLPGGVVSSVDLQCFSGQLQREGSRSLYRLHVAVHLCEASLARSWYRDSILVRKSPNVVSDQASQSHAVVVFSGYGEDEDDATFNHSTFLPPL